MDLYAGAIVTIFLKFFTVLSAYCFENRQFESIKARMIMEWPHVEMQEAKVCVPQENLSL